MCGNHPARNSGQSSARGSPPRVREPPGYPSYTDTANWITPACAGTTGRLLLGSLLLRDHPRVCGNHQSCPRSVEWPRGSPPRVREPHLPAILLCSLFGITPACAGTTLRYTLPEISAWDHPRVCGNHSTGRGRSRTDAGSPPRVREPHMEGKHGNIQQGITPACAGTTVPTLPRSRVTRDHPRVCGNHQCVRLGFVSAEGSPPRVREPRISNTPSIQNMRITPACAGTTDAEAGPECDSGDHPRVCGNHTRSSPHRTD